MNRLFPPDSLPEEIRGHLADFLSLRTTGQLPAGRHPRYSLPDPEVAPLNTVLGKRSLLILEPDAAQVSGYLGLLGMDYLKKLDQELRQGKIPGLEDLSLVADFLDQAPTDQHPGFVSFCARAMDHPAINQKFDDERRCMMSYIVWSWMEDEGQPDYEQRREYYFSLAIQNSKVLDRYRFYIKTRDTLAQPQPPANGASPTSLPPRGSPGI